ncbi:MAG: efflux RND transporter permease subunit [Polyangiaceae bacterium]
MSHAPHSGPEAEAETIAKTHNTARFFTENRQIAWVLFVAVIVWGIVAYIRMPKRKDPELPVRLAAAYVVWPGANAQKMEELVTRRLEETVAQNRNVERIESTTRNGFAMVTFLLEERVKDRGREFDDIALRLSGLSDLPQGVSKVQFQKDFGETTALMLTVASPRPSEVEIQLRAGGIQRGIEAVRKDAESGRRASLVYAFPATVEPRNLQRVLTELRRIGEESGQVDDVRTFSGPGYLGVDGRTKLGEAEIQRIALRFLQDRLHTSELHPDVWRSIVVIEPKETEAKLAEVAESKYSYRELDDYTDTLKKALERLPTVSKVTRSGVLAERVYLDFSQERLAAYGIEAPTMGQLLGARNITAPGGTLESQDKTFAIDPSGEFQTEQDIGDVLVSANAKGGGVYLRDVVDISRDYEAPPRLLNKYSRQDSAGNWERTRAITLAVDMRSGRQIGDFGAEVDHAIEATRPLLPEDLVMARTSDQPRQVAENVDLFMSSLYEAVGLVVLVALFGFREWRSALLLALSIPVTLLMTFGFMSLLGIDLQQISIASLIIALGLLVDDPVVANDAIKRELAEGHKPIVASWWGPTKLATAILFATITNVCAYLPFLLMPGDMGAFIYSLAMVLAIALVCSRIVSMTFVPMLGYYLLRAPKVAEPSMVERRKRGFGRVYSRAAGWAINHRWLVFAASMLLVGGGIVFSKRIKTSFFPDDNQYLSYIDIQLPGDAPLASTNETLRRVDRVIRETADEYGKAHPDPDGKPAQVLKSMTSFSGGGAPRFWFSVTQEGSQPSYAQVVVEVKDKHLTNHFIGPLQRALSREVPGAQIDVRPLATGAAIAMPVAIRVEGEDIQTLREQAEKLKQILRKSPKVQRVRDDWGADLFNVQVEVDPDRANLSGITNLDVARTSAASLNGDIVSSLREGDRQIPIVTRLRASERAHLSDVQNLYIRSQQTPTSVPLGQFSEISYEMVPNRIKRRNRVRAITVGAFPAEGVLPSQVLAEIRPELDRFMAEAPAGYQVAIAGEQEEQQKGFGNLVIVLGTSIAAIFLALVFQFRSAVKPLIVFAAIPYGVVGALVSLAVMNTPFGFMAFLGIISLIGVIVSHVIVLFDFIEERHAEGESLREALIDAGILRVRPVVITVGATVIALVPLASHGGPLWEPLCYVQIGGLTIATVITLFLVPVLYSIFVLDLKLVRWEQLAAPGGVTLPPEPEASVVHVDAPGSEDESSQSSADESSQSSADESSQSSADESSEDDESR